MNFRWKWSCFSDSYPYCSWIWALLAILNRCEAEVHFWDFFWSSEFWWLFVKTSSFYRLHLICKKRDRASAIQQGVATISSCQSDLTSHYSMSLSVVCSIRHCLKIAATRRQKKSSIQTRQWSHFCHLSNGFVRLSGCQKKHSGLLQAKVSLLGVIWVPLRSTEVSLSSTEFIWGQLSSYSSIWCNNKTFSCVYRLITVISKRHTKLYLQKIFLTKLCQFGCRIWSGF